MMMDMEEYRLLDGWNKDKKRGSHRMERYPIAIDSMVNEDIDVIMTNGGTGLDTRDITVETVESLFEKKLDGFGEIFRMKSYEEIGSAALLSRATAGIYKKSIIFSMPGSPNAVKTALNIIIDELPHFVHHVKK